MPKKFLRRFMPSKHSIKNNKHLNIFGDYIHNPNLWHLTRHSVARAFTIGLFFAWVPVPFQMVLAAGGAILFHANLPISVALVWLTNPITMPPLFYFSYKIGAFILDTKQKIDFTDFFNNLIDIFMSFEPSLHWINTTLQHLENMTKPFFKLWQPFLLGCFICGLLSAVLGNITIRIIWRYFAIKNWKNRKQKK